MLAELLPQRLAQVLAATHLPPGEMANIPDRALVAFGERLQCFEFRPIETEGYAKAEVTLAGSIPGTSHRRRWRRVPFPVSIVIGEAVDVTGWLGGYNFQWAWSSGWTAGQAI